MPLPHYVWFVIEIRMGWRHIVQWEIQLFDDNCAVLGITSFLRPPNGISRLYNIHVSIWYIRTSILILLSIFGYDHIYLQIQWSQHLDEFIAKDSLVRYFGQQQEKINVSMPLLSSCSNAVLPKAKTLLWQNPIIEAITGYIKCGSIEISRYLKVDS